jgi:hypothetical protein
MVDRRKALNHRDRLDAAWAVTLEQTLPHRFAYFDGQRSEPAPVA